MSRNSKLLTYGSAALILTVLGHKLEKNKEKRYQRRLKFEEEEERKLQSLRDQEEAEQEEKRRIKREQRVLSWAKAEKEEALLAECVKRHLPKHLKEIGFTQILKKYNIEIPLGEGEYETGSHDQPLKSFLETLGEILSYNTTSGRFEDPFNQYFPPDHLIFQHYVNQM